MQLRFNSKLVWLMMALLTVVGGRTSANTAAAPLAVELNGLCSILGDKRAFFVLNSSAATDAHSYSFMLAEGESEGGIKLIAVDMAANCVRIENCGQTQSLRICGTPNLSLFPDSPTAGNADRFLARGRDGPVGTPGADDLVAEITPGNPGWGTLPPVAVGNSSSPKQNATASQSATPNPSVAGNSKGSDPVAMLKGQADNEWYQEAASIEQNRIDTASQVLAGEMTPWPRTPLTPTGTAGELVGNEVYFSNHIPGYVATGSLNE